MPQHPLPGLGVRAGKAIKKGDGAGLQLLAQEKPTALFWAKRDFGKIQSKASNPQGIGKLQIPEEASAVCPSNGSRMGRADRTWGTR